MSDERRRARQMKATMAAMSIARRLGAVDSREAVEHVRVAALAAVAECRAVWFFMQERGIATEAQYQDYLDKGYDSVLNQVQDKASEIMVYDGKPS